MSAALDLANYVHDQQLKAAEKGRELLASGLGRAKDLLDRTPDLPPSVSAWARGVTRPVAQGMDRQMDFMYKTQDVVVEALVARTRENPAAAEPSSEDGGRARRLLQPVAAVVGTPQEFATFTATSARDWAAVRDGYRGTVHRSLSGSTATAG